MAKKGFIAGAFVALMIVVGISIYYRAFWERDPEQLSEAGQMAVDLAEVLREQETAREVERAAEARQEELQARRAAWEEIRRPSRKLGTLDLQLRLQLLLRANVSLIKPPQKQAKQAKRATTPRRTTGPSILRIFVMRCKR